MNSRRARPLALAAALCLSLAARAAEPEPSPIPPPLPPPGSVVPPLGTGDDPLDLLWAHRLNFAAGGKPLVTIRLMEGQDRVEFRPRGSARGARRLAAGARRRTPLRGAGDRGASGGAGAPPAARGSGARRSGGAR